MKANSHSGHRERMRSRYLNEGGLDSFEDHQILEMLLFYAIPRRDTNELAHKMIREFGSLEALVNSRAEAIAARTGVSLNTAVLVSMIGSIQKRRGSLARRGICLKEREEVKKYCMQLFRGRQEEVLYVLCLDKNMRLIAPVEVAEGGDKQVYARLNRVLAQIGTMGAVYAICTHNHPSGTNTFSVDDISSTIKIRTGLAQHNIKLMDHILVCGDEAVSLSETKKFKF
ncbi:MAG: RadC family protein [Firmicutes bacterium]|nr:RadC family protein [Bacillota bacterium]